MYRFFPVLQETKQISFKLSASASRFEESLVLEIGEAIQTQAIDQQLQESLTVTIRNKYGLRNDEFEIMLRDSMAEIYFEENADPAALQAEERAVRALLEELNPGHPGLDEEVYETVEEFGKIQFSKYVLKIFWDQWLINHSVGVPLEHSRSQSGKQLEWDTQAKPMCLDFMAALNRHGANLSQENMTQMLARFEESFQDLSLGELREENAENAEDAEPSVSFKR